DLLDLIEPRRPAQGDFFLDVSSGMMDAQGHEAHRSRIQVGELVEYRKIGSTRKWADHFTALQDALRTPGGGILLLQLENFSQYKAISGGLYTAKLRKIQRNVFADSAVAT
ncbi:MAG TPA: hypothetical protein VNH41_02730, partial [Steroidobacteraceae bacterium]|nr:hypothetical protein [Steroidobacteraceae bacterium]